MLSKPEGGVGGVARDWLYFLYHDSALRCFAIRGDDEISVDKQLGRFNRGSSYSALLGVQGQGYEWVCAVMLLEYAVIRDAAGLSGYGCG